MERLSEEGKKDVGLCYLEMYANNATTLGDINLYIKRVKEKIKEYEFSAKDPHRDTTANKNRLSKAKRMLETLELKRDVYLK